ncbi:MAG TPA: alkaline phosphatase family protein [Solirubrobacteraceae bacterium]|nr:alkaline phosphatase family protein [Solirubrobacteraceae bacterium]
MARKRVLYLLTAALLLAGASVTVAQARSHRPGKGRGPHHGRGSHHGQGSHHGHGSTTATPIKHVVVIFQENESFDHYFGTYPTAANTDGQPFHASRHTPAVDGLAPATSPSLPPSLRHSDNLLTSNPNAAQPQRLDSSATGASGSAGGQLTCDEDHNYGDEQQAFDGGKMDHFVQSVGTDGTTKSPFGSTCQASQVMDYFDGNTVTALWNYAQHFSMSDNSFGVTFGPSAPGAINVTAGDTGNVDTSHMANNPTVSTATSPNGDLTPDGKGGFSMTNDAQPYWDDCSTRDALAFNGTNIGDVLNKAGLSWGWFEGGFRPTTTFAAASAAPEIGHSGQPTSQFIPDEFVGNFTGKNVPANAANQGLCDAVHPIGVALGGTGQWGYKDDYIPHHEPFQYYASTANPHHLTVPANGAGQDTLAGLKEIGRDTQSFANGVPQFNTPNHQYDTSDFDQLVAAIRRGRLTPDALPAVSFLKAPGYQDAHPGYSDPADEQAFVTREINSLMRTPDWQNTVVIVNYDDSDGWYDHVYSGVTNPSLSPADNLTNTTFTLPTSGQCGPNPQTTAPLAGEQGRCGFGPRLPMLVISPFARVNGVDHNLSDQASILNLIEFNWHLPGIPGSADQVLSGLNRSRGLKFDLAGMFDFRHPRGQELILNPVTGQPTAKPHHKRHRHKKHHGKK